MTCGNGVSDTGTTATYFYRLSACRVLPLCSLFLPRSATVCRMEQQTFASWLKAQRRIQGYRTQKQLAEAIGVSERAIRNYEAGKTPDPGNRAAIEELLGGFKEGDPVEIAVRESELHEWRQDAVLSAYKRNLHEQRAEAAG